MDFESRPIVSVLGTAHSSVPIFVPTPCIEAFRTAEKPPKRSRYMLRDQEVGASNPLAPTNLFEVFSPPFMAERVKRKTANRPRDEGVP
jgi:hypothetical protein